MRPRNQVCARRNSLLFYLELPADVLWERIRSDPGSALTRPNLSSGGLEEVSQMLAQRAPVYRACAHKVLDGTQSAEQLTEAVLSRF
jgi:shikimate kinase